MIRVAQSDRGRRDCRGPVGGGVSADHLFVTLVSGYDPESDDEHGLRDERSKTRSARRASAANE